MRVILPKKSGKRAKIPFLHAEMFSFRKTTALGLILMAAQSYAFAEEAHTTVPLKKVHVSVENVQTAVKGTVRDQDGTPLSGVSVIEKGTSNGASTDANGNFSLTLQSSSAILQFIYVGYETLERSASENLSQVILQSTSEQLDEVVIVGYGTQKKAHLTGAVSSIGGEELESRPVQNVGQALQGVMPGLNVQTTGLGGELNQNMSFNIRGAGTIGVGSSSAPLVLIDGMEGNLNAINPQDIENITVLKDAAASSIYGSRAPFGVILITTKSGKEGRTTVNYNNNVRLGQPRGLPTMLDSRTFAYYFNEVAANSGEAPKFSQEVIERIEAYQRGDINTVSIPTANGRWEYYQASNANTDWFKEFYRDFTTSHDHSLSVSGGTEKINFFTSGNFMDQNGLNRYAEDNFQRYSLANKINVKISDNLDLTSNTRFVREDYDRPVHMNALYYHNIARRWPTVPVRDDNGYFSEQGEAGQLTNGGRATNQKDLLYQQLELRFRPIQNWNVVGNVNYRITNHNDHSEVLRVYAYDVDENPYLIPVSDYAAGYTHASEYNNKEEYFSTNLYTDYSFDIDTDHQFKVLFGFNSELNKYRNLTGTRLGLIVDDVPTLNTAIGNPSTSGGYAHWATAGFFGRFNYSYKDRYLLEINGRYDGSSRFPRELRWNLFPSYSVGWNIANEDFFPWKEQISMLKLRGSYGELGNQYTQNWYPFYSTMPVTSNSGSWLIGATRPNTAGAPGLIASTLTWERVTSWNIGADIQTFNNRLDLALEVYKRNTFDMIGPAPELPAILGTAVPRLNNAEMYSRGIELNVNWKDRIGEVNYSVRAILSDDVQTVTKYPNPTGSLTTWYDGRRNGEIWGYTTLGIAKTQEEMDAHLANTTQSFSSQWFAGDIMYEDRNGDGIVNAGGNTLSNPGDLKIIGYQLPRYNYSFDLNASYKGFDVRAFFQGVGKRDYMPNGPYFWGANGGMWQSAGFEENMDFFRDETSVMVQNGVLDINTDAYLPKPYFGNTKNQQTQTRYLQNAAYLRLKNAQIGYTLDPNKISKLGLSRVRVYVSGENLLTFTKMAKVFDPESVGLGGWNDGKTYPFSTVYSFGLNINF